MNKVLRLSLITILLLCVLCSLIFYGIFFALNKKNVDGKYPKTVQIESGMSVVEIGALLRKEKLINSATLFTLYVKYSKIVPQAGVYTLEPNLSLRQIAEGLKIGVDDVRVTIIEGIRAEEVADVFASKLAAFDSAQFLKLVQLDNLEGQLFPDTYLINKSSTTEEVLRLLQSTFLQKTEELFKTNNSGFDEHEVLKLASIVEREESDPNERSLVAGILIGRFKRGEVLGADATIQYMFGKKGDYWPKGLTQEQLDTVAPFNTRKVAGLTPNPICNPGLSAIKAVIQAQETPYVYYLHDKQGKVHYAKTYEEHQSNIVRYL